MKVNQEKFQFMILSKKSHEAQSFFITICTIHKSHEEELPKLTIDKELKLSKHIDKLCRNAQYKFHALRQIRKYLGLKQKC